MPTWVSPAYTATDIIRRAARLCNERLVVEGRDPQRTIDYYTAFNDAMKAVATTRYWYFLARECAFASKSGQSTYVLTRPTVACRFAAFRSSTRRWSWTVPPTR